MLAPSAESAKMIDTINLIAADATSSSFYTLYFILSTVMKYVWQTFNSLQIFLVLPMLTVKMPVNARTFRTHLKSL
jgi:hypothetical protein